MKRISILLFSILLIGCLVQTAFAGKRREDDTRLTKEIERGFKVRRGVTIEVNNKYGQIVVNSWDRDSVEIRISITAYGKNDDAVDKMMDRVDFDFNNTTNFLTMETVFDRNSGVLKNLWNSVSDASMSLISKNKITVNYEIMVPQMATLELINRFGDIYVNRHGGKLIVDLSHGDLKASNLTAPIDISLGYGRASLRSVSEARLLVKGGEMDVTSASKIYLESNASDIDIEDVHTLRLDSRNDKIRITEATYLTGKANFTDIDVRYLFENVDLDMLYGELAISNVMSSFSTVRVSGRTADLSLNFDPLSSFNVDISGREDRIILPKEMVGLKKTVDPDEDKDITLRGSYGEASSKELDLRIDNGDIIITFKEPVPYTTDQN